MKAPNDWPAEPRNRRCTPPAKPLSPWRTAMAPATRAQTLRSVLMMSTSLVTVPSLAMADATAGSARMSSSRTRPRVLTPSCRRWVLLRSVVPTLEVRKLRSRPAVLARGPGFCSSRSQRPITSSRVAYPMLARMARTSSATKVKKLTRSPGAPGNRARSSSRWLATPTGQLLVWQMRAMMQPVAIMAMVPKPYSSAPIRAARTTSEPSLRPPSARRTTRSRRPLVRRVLWDSVSPISTGPPACLMLLMGLAPVPPSWPLIWMTSALALATPDATVPIPAWPTSLTLTLAAGLIMCRS